MAATNMNVVLRRIQELAAAERASQQSDQQLLERFLEHRDETAFEALVRRHGPMVLGVCRRFLGNRPEADDAFQATFLVLANKARTIAQRASLGGWLHQVAANAALRARGCEAIRRRHEKDVPRRSPADPLDELTARELLAVLDEELRLLPERHRTVLVLCYLEGRLRDEAARQLGWTLGTLKRRLEQARRYLRSRLIRRGVTLSAALLSAELARTTATAAVQSTLVSTTVRVALLPLSAGADSTPALLAKSVLASLGVGKLKGLKIGALLSCLFLLGAGFLSQSTPTHPQSSATNPEAAAIQTKKAESPRVEDIPLPAQDKGTATASVPMTISGRVVDPDGKDMPSAEVAVVAWSHRMPREGEGSPRPEVWAHGKVDETGRFQLTPRRSAPLRHVADNHYQMAVLAGRAGYGMGWHFLRFDAANADLKMTLYPEQSRRGRVIDIAGLPAKGVRLDVVSMGTPAPKYEMIAANRHLDRETIWGYAGQGPAEAKGEPNAAGAGHPPAGLGLWQGEVYFEEAPERLPCWPGAATTDADGRFVLRGVGKNQTVRVRIRGNDQVASELHRLAASDDTEPAEAAIACGSPFLIEGTITEADSGRPIPKARVHVEVAGAAIFFGSWPVPADWKGRQHCAGDGFVPGGLPSLAAPSQSGVTDQQGRYRISAFRSDFYKTRSFAVVVSGTDEQPYLTVKKTISWPRGAIKQKVDLTVPRGILVRGRVVEQTSGKPVADARVDFWQKGLKFRNDTNAITLLPDGVLHPYPRSTDLDGNFQIIVPPGRSYLLVNGPIVRGIFPSAYTFDTIATAELGIENPYLETSWVFIPPGGRVGKKPTYHPDRLVTLDTQTGKTQERLTVTLRRAPLLKGRVLGPDGKPATNVRLIQSQEPFMEPIAEGSVFGVPIRNLDAPLCMLFVDAEHNLGTAASFTARQAEGDPVTVRLAPCGSASFRMRDAAGKPLVNEQPALWLSLPAAPYSAPQDLEKLIAHKSHGWNYDAIWSSDAKTKTDADGRITMTGLVPGATYRLLLSKGKAKDFRVDSGRTIDLGDLTITEPDKLRVPKLESKK